MGQPTRRSVDSQCSGRAIEPREHYPREPSSWTARGPRRHHRYGLVVRSRRGRRTRHRHIRVPQELGTPCDSSRHQFGAGAAGPRSPWPAGTRSGPAGAKHRRTAWYRQAKHKEARRDGRRESERSHSTDEAGEPNPREPGGGKGAPGCGTVGRKHGRCSGTGSRVNETTADSGAGEAVAADGDSLRSTTTWTCSGWSRLTTGRARTAPRAWTDRRPTTTG